jgi:RNA polymerase I-specific transcription initiation factor RRN5
LGSTDSSRLRKHDNLRRHEVEARYNDNYRQLFNEHVTEVASRFDINESIQHYSNQVGSSVWSSTEQTVFFAALERLGKDDIPGIAGAIGTKTETEAREFLILLQDAAIKQGDTKLTLRDIPAAIEVGSACDQQLDQAGDALAWYQERFEATQEQQRYGKYWLITGSVADEVEDAINGVARPRSASTPHDREPPRIGSGVAGYVFSTIHIQ